MFNLDTGYEQLGPEVLLLPLDKVLTHCSSPFLDIFHVPSYNPYNRGDVRVAARCNVLATVTPALTGHSSLTSHSVMLDPEATELDAIKGEKLRPRIMF